MDAQRCIQFRFNVTGGTPNYQFSIDDQVNWVTTNTFTNLGAGVYLAYTKDANTCTQLTAVKLGQSTADIIEVEEDLMVYPNPSKGMVFVEGNSVENVILTGLNGQNIAAPTIKLTNGWMVDLQEMVSGVYILSLDVKGTMKHVKIVKE